MKRSYKKTARGRRTRYPKKGKKKSYGRKKGFPYYTMKSARPQRRNLKTNLLSHAPRIGFKPVKYGMVLENQVYTSGTVASYQATTDNYGNDELTINEFGGAWFMANSKADKGSGVGDRIGEKIRVHRIEGRMQLRIPPVEDQVGTGTTLVGGPETFRVMFVIDHQLNQDNLSWTPKNILKVESGVDFTNAVYDEVGRRRFTILYDKSFTVNQPVIAAADNKYYGPDVQKNIDIRLDRKTTIQYASGKTAGDMQDITSGAIMCCYGFTNKMETQFGIMRYRTIGVTAQLRCYYTDA